MNALSEDEVLVLLLGIGVLLFIIFNRKQIRRIRFRKILLAGYYILLAGWCFTIIEGYIFEKLFNFLEHGSYVVSSLVFVTWSVKSFFKGGREEQL
jgi:hypothetical protein